MSNPVMHTHLATRFARTARVLRAEAPLSEDQMRCTAPSIFAEGKHASRSERYTYIPTIQVLRGLAQEGFQPFMVAQGHSRVEGKAAYTKHLVRLRHAGQARTREEVNEIILINSHDGASSYQMLGGAFRFICLNGLVVGNVAHDIRVPHKGDVQGEVIEGAFRVLQDFEAVNHAIGEMKSTTLNTHEEQALATAALALRFDEGAAPVSAEQLAQARRVEDLGHSLWANYQRLQENSLRGGLPGRAASGRRVHTRPVASIDGSVALNRALWVLAQEMHKLKH